MSIINIAMRASAFLWILLSMALIGNMIAIKSGPAIINYDLFVTVFCMLSLFYLIPASFKDSLAFSPIIPLVLDVLCTLFTFVAGVATPAYQHVHSCNNDSYVNSNTVTRGSESRCREAQASTAFFWFAFASFAVSTVMSGLGSRGGSAPGPRRGPAMSQV